MKVDISIRPLAEADLPAAGLPEPTSFMDDADYVRTHWRTDPMAAFAAEVDGEFAGSNFATHGAASASSVR